MKLGQGWIGFASAAGGVLAATVAGFALRGRFDLVNIAMVYLLAVVVIAVRFTRADAILASMLSVAAFDYFFVPPYGTFTVDDLQYLLTFAIMVAVALVISQLVNDVRHRARAEAKLQVEAESERIRSALLASISHDVRTPLAVVMGGASTLAERGEQLDAEERRALARSVAESARDMSDHVAKVLQMTRLETGSMKVESDWASVGEIVASALERLRERLAGHYVMVEVPPDLPLVRVDAGLVEQALFNLLENAAKHTRPGTVVRVRAQRREQELLVSVEDFAGDLPESEMERVFEKFHRGRLEGPAGGVGLGLAICRAIVRLHGGRAWAERIAEGGTAFRFTLPLEPAPPVPAEPALAPE